jgi:hypothetical protein
MAIRNIQGQILNALGVSEEELRYVTKADIKLNEKGVFVTLERLVIGDLKDGLRELEHITTRYELIEKQQ